MERLKRLEIPRRMQNAALFTIDYNESRFYFDHIQTLNEDASSMRCTAQTHLHLIMAVGGQGGTTLADDIDRSVGYRVRRAVDGRLWVALTAD